MTSIVTAQKRVRLRCLASLLSCSTFVALLLYWTAYTALVKTLDMATDLIYKNMKEHHRQHNTVAIMHSALALNVAMIISVFFSLDLNLNRKNCLLLLQLFLLVHLILSTSLFYGIKIVFSDAQRQMNSTIYQQLDPFFLSYKKSVLNKSKVDMIQLKFGCCGLRSHRDWFNQDWFVGSLAHQMLTQTTGNTTRYTDSNTKGINQKYKKNVLKTPDDRATPSEKVLRSPTQLLKEDTSSSLDLESLRVNLPWSCCSSVNNNGQYLAPCRHINLAINGRKTVNGHVTSNDQMAINDRVAVNDRGCVQGVLSMAVAVMKLTGAVAILLAIQGLLLTVIGSLFATAALDARDFVKGHGRGYMLPFLNRKPYQSFKGLI